MNYTVLFNMPWAVQSGMDRHYADADYLSVIFLNFVCEYLQESDIQKLLYGFLHDPINVMPFF